VRWVKHKGRAAVHGFKAHVGADANTALVEEVAVAPANVNDGKAGPDALPDAPCEVFADSAYRGKTFREAVRVKGGSLRASPSPACGAGTRPKRWRAFRLGIRRSTAFVAASRRSYIRDVEAQLWPSAHAMARTGEGRSADPLHRNRVQYQALFQDSRLGLTTPPKGFG
jgi:transposase